MYGRTVFLDPKGLSFMENTLCSDFVLIIYPNRQNSLEVLQKKSDFCDFTNDLRLLGKVASRQNFKNKSKVESRVALFF